MNEIQFEKLINSSLEKGFEKLKSGDSHWAEEIYRQILVLSPENKQAKSMLAIACSANHKHEEAISLISPQTYQDYNNLALILGAANKREKAIETYKKALSLHHAPFLLSNLAMEYTKIGDWDKAYETMSKALRDFPDSDQLWFNYGTMKQEQQHFEEAIEIYSKSSLAAAHYNTSICYFLIKDYKKAWEKYEWRWKQFPFKKKQGKYWKGESLKNKKILLYCEQGLGDMIQFYRYAKYLEGTVFIELAEELKTLLPGEEGEYDYYCSVLTAAGILGVNQDNISGKPYLKADKLDLNYEKPWIGICWAGNPVHPNDRNRSCYLKHFDFPGTMFSLQKDFRPRIYGNEIIDYCSGMTKKVIIKELGDFSDTARLIESMDVVVTVDTAVGHLAGALGKKCYIIIPENHDWRWKVSWYDSVELIINKNWQETLTSLANRIKQSF